MELVIALGWQSTKMSHRRCWKFFAPWRLCVNWIGLPLARCAATAYSAAKSATFATLVENVRSFSMEEKLELKSVLERALIEERLKEILADYRCSLAELKTRKPRFSSSISELKKSLAEK